ncbi:MAG: YciI family protein [Myxococcota bacterium]|nr:YciI family protein [Myxococcota bacterium]
MQYALLLYSKETDLPDAMPDADREAFYAEFREFVAALQKEGAFLGAQRLEVAGTAVSVRVEQGEALVSDGPFAETKEILAGFFLLECPDQETAVAWAKRIPSARIGTVEVRPVR